VMGVSYLEQELENVFVQLGVNRLASYVVEENVLEEIKGKIPVMINHHLTLLKFCKENSKPSIFNWTVNLGYDKYHQVMEEFFVDKKFTFMTGLTAD
jgi:hypothetical protein